MKKILGTALTFGQATTVYLKEKQNLLTQLQGDMTFNHFIPLTQNNITSTILGGSLGCY